MFIPLSLSLSPPPLSLSPPPSLSLPLTSLLSLPSLSSLSSIPLSLSPPSPLSLSAPLYSPSLSLPLCSCPPPPSLSLPPPSLSLPSLSKPTAPLLLALFHCMVRPRYGTVTVHFWGVFHWVLQLVTWYFFSTTSVEVPSDLYRYQNVTCKLYWSLIGWRESSLLRHWTCDTRPSFTARPARFKSAQPAKDRTQLLFKQRTFLHQPQNSSVVVCWGSTDVPLVDSRGADPVRAWWRDAEGKSLMYITLLWTCYIFRVCFLFIFYLCICVLLQLKTIWSNKCTSRLY